MEEKTVEGVQGSVFGEEDHATVRPKRKRMSEDECFGIRRCRSKNQKRP